MFRTIREVREFARETHAGPGRLGFVPTMGALHEGHATLIREASAANDRVVVSIFVNPLQFDRPDDLAAYPVTLDADLALAHDAGADAVFVPAAREMYPPGFETVVDLPEVAKPLCGRFRPGHFKGVATVVLKLLNIVGPDRAYFGEKDYQQLLLIEKLVRDLALPVEIRRVATVREADGLAMSSRNRRLSAEERVRARAIPDLFAEAERLVATGAWSPDRPAEPLLAFLRGRGIDRIDYAEARDPDTLGEWSTATPRPARFLLAVAVRVGAVRLIDNRVLTTAA